MHMIVVQQRICYDLCGLPNHIPSTWMELYDRDTIPSEQTPIAPIEMFLDIALQTEKDWQQGLFDQITLEPRTLGANVQISNLAEAFKFVNFHEGMHLGYILAQRKALGL